MIFFIVYFSKSQVLSRFIFRSNPMTLQKFYFKKEKNNYHTLIQSSLIKNYSCNSLYKAESVHVRQIALKSICTFSPHPLISIHTLPPPAALLFQQSSLTPFAIRLEAHIRSSTLYWSMPKRRETRDQYVECDKYEKRIIKKGVSKGKK